MHTITLVSTRHDELGKCNSNELYQIFEQIDPDLIFEEIPPSFFGKYYVEKTHHNLESKAISKYSRTHKTAHIPVDLDSLPTESFFQDYKDMLQRIEGLTDINGFNYRTLTDSNRSYAGQYGFNYLNNTHCIKLNDEIQDAIVKGLEKIDNDQLSRTYNLWNENNNKREIEMLQNIYEYSAKHYYDRAIFTVGAGHRKSLIQKIYEYQRNTKLRLNWIFYTT